MQPYFKKCKKSLSIALKCQQKIALIILAINTSSNFRVPKSLHMELAVEKKLLYLLKSGSFFFCYGLWVFIYVMAGKYIMAVFNISNLFHTFLSFMIIVKMVRDCITGTETTTQWTLHFYSLITKFTYIDINQLRTNTPLYYFNSFQNMEIKGRTSSTLVNLQNWSIIQYLR